jgi:hypothetical protein
MCVGGLWHGCHLPLASAGGRLQDPLRRTVSICIRSNMYKVIPTGWYFDVNSWCYMGSLVMSAHKGNFL